MKIANKSIQGLFEFKTGVEYEKGDMVVYNNCIYNALITKISDKTPDQDTDGFIIYLGELVSTLSDYYKVVGNNNSDNQDLNKYVSSYLLSSILQREFFGINDSGIITEFVEYDNAEDTVKMSDNLRNLIESEVATKKVLDSILNCPTLNNGLVRVDYNLQEIQDIYLESVEEERENNPYYLLRQYTYKGNLEIYRVQELIDPVNGNNRYRWCKGEVMNEVDEVSGENYYQFSNPSDWVISTLYVEENSDVTEKVKEIIRCYNKKSERNTAILNQLTNSYKNAVCWPLNNEEAASKVNLLCSAIDNYDLEEKKSQILTVSIKRYLPNKIIQRYSTSIDLSDIEEGSNSVSYYLDNDVLLKVVSGSSMVTLSVTNGLITNISYRKNYVG